jgi:putative membrane protein
MASMDQETRQAIETKIQELEKVTSAEFVPVVYPRCSSYRSLRLALALGAALLMTLAENYFLIEGPSELKTVLPVGTALLVYGLTRFSWWFRALLPDAIFLKTVEMSAYQAFLANEVFATRDRTGILIFISEFEKAAFVMADRGLEKALQAHQLQDLGAHLAADLQNKCSGQAFLTALDALIPKLSEHFPPRSDDQNEISNHVRTT